MMNLKKPFVNEEVKTEMQSIMYEPLEKEFTIKSGMDLFITKGFNKFVKNDFLDLFFVPFFRIISKEKEFSDNLKK